MKTSFNRYKSLHFAVHFLTEHHTLASQIFTKKNESNFAELFSSTDQTFLLRTQAPVSVRKKFLCFSPKSLRAKYLNRHFVLISQFTRRKKIIRTPVKLSQISIISQRLATRTKERYIL